VACPAACIAGLEDFSQAVEAGGFQLLSLDCLFDTNRQAGLVSALYPTPDGPLAHVLVGSRRCSADIEGSAFVDMSVSDPEQAACAPLAIDILPGVDESNCDISPP
jgi:hypothetical protein